MSCKLRRSLVRVHVTYSCTSCTDSQLYTITNDSSFVIPKLPAGNYTVNVTAVGMSNDIIRTVEVIVMSEDVTIDISPTSGSTTNRATTNVPTTTSTSSTTDSPTTGNVHY